MIAIHAIVSTPMRKWRFIWGFKAWKAAIFRMPPVLRGRRRGSPRHAAGVAGGRPLGSPAAIGRPLPLKKTLQKRSTWESGGLRRGQPQGDAYATRPSTTSLHRTSTATPSVPACLSNRLVQALGKEARRTDPHGGAVAEAVVGPSVPAWDGVGGRKPRTDCRRPADDGLAAVALTDGKGAGGDSGGYQD